MAATATLHQVEGNLVVDNIINPTTLRRSERSKSSADVHILHKAEKVAAKKNLESPGMSFTSFSDSKIAENLGRIGINLGSSEDLVRASTVAIKNLEVDRMVVHANIKKNKHKKIFKPLLPESDDEKEARLDAILGHVCGKSNENVRVIENDLILDLSPVDRKKKSSLAKNLKKGKSSKKPKTPTKIVIQ
jgi:translation initiation factor IF-1